MSPSQEERIADYCTAQMNPEDVELFEQEMVADDALAHTVASSLERLNPLDETAEPLVLSQSLWQKIEAELRRDASPPTPRVQDRPLRSIWQSLRFWRWTGLAGLTASAALATLLIVVMLQPSPPPQFVAILVPANGSTPGAVVEVSADGEARLISLQDVAVPADRALQVWTLPSRERGPVSIGLLSEPQSAILDLGRLPPTRAEQLFEITLEPAAGSPTGRPTGPILFKGLAAQAL